MDVGSITRVKSADMNDTVIESCLCREHNKLGDRSFSAAGPRLRKGSDYGGTDLRLLQTISENSFIWQPKRLVTLLNL